MALKELFKQLNNVFEYPESSGIVWWQWLKTILLAPPSINIRADDVLVKTTWKLPYRWAKIYVVKK